MDLDTLERDFQALVIDGAPGIERAVVGTAGVPVTTRLAIYSNAYRARLTEALESNYPKLAKLLGEQQFGELALHCIERYPSTHFSVRWFGEHLSELLADTSPYREQPLLAELALWEWSMTLAFDAADVSVMTRASLSEYPPETWGDLSFAFHSSMQLLALRTNAPAVWRALGRNEPPPEAVRETTTLDWLVWRRGLDTLYRSLSIVEARALRAARDGASFATLCEVLASELGEDAAALEAAKLLARWVDEQLVSAVIAA
jgi:hypothetical protein